jgi:hypothetical protein
MPNAGAGGFSFLRFPTEIQLLVLAHILVHSADIVVNMKGRARYSKKMAETAVLEYHTDDWRLGTNVLRTCTKVERLSVSLLYGQNRFRFSHEVYELFCTRLRPITSQYIRHVILSFNVIRPAPLQIERFLRFNQDLQWQRLKTLELHSHTSSDPTHHIFHAQEFELVRRRFTKIGCKVTLEHKQPPSEVSMCLTINEPGEFFRKTTICLRSTMY